MATELSRKKMQKLRRSVRIIRAIRKSRQHPILALQQELAKAGINVNWAEVTRTGTKTLEELNILSFNPFDEFPVKGQDEEPKAQKSSIPSWVPEATAALVVLLALADGPAPVGDIVGAILIGAVADAALDDGSEDTHGGDGEEGGDSGEDGGEEGGDSGEGGGEEGSDM